MNGAHLSNEPILLFLHGVGTGDKDDNWRAALTETLIQLGYPELDIERVIAPKFAHALKDWDETIPMPVLTAKPLSRELAKQNRRDFEHRTAAIEFRLGRHDGGISIPGIDAVVAASVGLPFFEQARNYLKKPQIRANILDIILGKLPPSGKLVIVAHSLGSVIAADLIPRLPIGLEVAALVTIGSPLANGSFDVEDLRKTLNDPPANLSWWVNFWNPFDPVAAHRGLSSVFPWLVDFRVQSSVSLNAHDAVNYLKNKNVAEAVGFALFGSKSKEIVRFENGADIALDTAERLTLLALRYAYLIKSRLEGDLQNRYAGALRQVQASAIDAIRVRNERENRPIPHEIARLAFDFSDPDAIVLEPFPSSHIGKEEAVLFLTTIATENIIRPFEISIPKDKKDKKKDTRQEAMTDLTAEMGLGGRFGTSVFDAAERASQALSGGVGANWVKWGALGVGAAALVIAPVGLVFAAGAGLAGAAAITSALAAFGPGGMIGGLLTAGTLIGAGSGGVAFGLASSGTSAETFEAVVSRQMAAVILRKDQDLEQDPAIWQSLVETEIEVRRQYERLDEFSDESALSLKELKRKIEAIVRALNYMSENGLEPGIVPGASGKTGRKLAGVFALGAKER